MNELEKRRYQEIFYNISKINKKLNKYDTILESIGAPDDQIMERKIMLILLRLQTSTQFSMIYLSQDPSKCILPTLGTKYHYKTYAMTDKFSKVLSKSFCKQKTLTKQDIDKVIKEMMQKIRFNE